MSSTAALEGSGNEETPAHSAGAGDDSADEQPQPQEPPQQPQQPSLDVLPDDVLSHVFVLIGAQEGRALPLVSHRWHHLYFSEPRLWSPFTVSRASMAQRPEAEWQGWLTRRAALAQRVSQHVACFDWRAADAGEPDLGGPSAAAFVGGLPSFLEALQPSRLAELNIRSLRQLPQAAAAALEHLTGVTHLSLNGCEPEAAAAVVTTLRGGLLSMFCRPWHDGRLADAICSLPHLTHAVVATEGFQPRAVSLQQLTRLTQLRYLRILCGHESQSPVRVPDPASFANLETYSMESLSRPLEIAGAHLGMLEMHRGPFDSFGGSVSLLNTLKLASIQELPSLGRLLAALLPPAAPPLERLVVFSGALDASSLVNFRQLHHLQELHLIFVQGSDGIGAELAALLRQTPHLAALQVTGKPGPGGSLPALTWDSVCPHLSACSQLTRLVLMGQLVQDLPDGEYLAGLRSLTLWGNRLRSVPAALSVATQLTYLDLGCNPLLTCSEADVEMLASLPSLRHFNIWDIDPDPAVYERLAASLPHVTLPFELCPFNPLDLNV